MTIQSAFNEITETLGGTPSTDGTITGAIDALNDTLAGSNQERGTSIEDGIRLLGEHIISGGDSEFSTVLVTVTNTSDESQFTFERMPNSYPLLNIIRSNGTIDGIAPISSSIMIAPSTSVTFEFLYVPDANEIPVSIPNTSVVSEPSIEGSIEKGEALWDYVIFGNCTITAEGKELPK